MIRLCSLEIHFSRALLGSFNACSIALLLWYQFRSNLKYIHGINHINKKENLQKFARSFGMENVRVYSVNCEFANHFIKNASHSEMQYTNPPAKNQYFGKVNQNANMWGENEARKKAIIYITTSNVWTLCRQNEARTMMNGCRRDRENWYAQNMCTTLWMWGHTCRILQFAHTHTQSSRTVFECPPQHYSA